MKKVLNLFLITIYTLAVILLLDKIRDIVSIKELIALITIAVIISLSFYLLFRFETLDIITHISLFFITMMIFSFSIKTDSIFSFVAGIVTDTNIVDNYRVIVLNGNIESIEELENKNIGYTKDTLGFSDLNISFDSICYDSFEQLIEALEKKDIDAAIILIEKYEMLDQQKFKIISDFSSIEEVKSVYKNILEETTLIYVSGMDNYEALNKTSRSDVNMVIGINNKTKQLVLLSIPRDYYVTLASKGEMDKLTHAGIYGINESINTISDLLEHKMDYYIKINFASLEHLIDTIGGIEVDSEESFVSSGIEFTKGINYLNGKEALTFSRERKGFIGGDRTRGENQQRVIEGIVKKVTSKEILNNYMNILSDLKDSFQTNIPETEILKIIKNQIVENPNWKIVKYSLNGNDSYQYTYSYKCCKLYVMEPDMQTVYEGITLIEYLKEGGIFN